MISLLDHKQQFRNALITWYYREKRDLPWRRTSNPYYIWISEVMLQQTRVETVIPYYERFTEKFPVPEALAYAEEEELLKQWEGLGYYSRVRNLQLGVREVVESYGGEVPRSRKEISSLRGIGPYTAGAILSIAFGIPEHAVDGNVMRVLSRLLLIEEDIAVPKTRKIFEGAVMDIIDENDPSAFNQGLMELGATICTPRPRCLLCPVREFCSAYHEGRQEELPVKTKKMKMKIMPLAAFALRDSEGRWLMTKRPEKGLLANMWEFPLVDLSNAELPVPLFEKMYEAEISDVSQLEPLTHVFSHLTWDLKVIAGMIRKMEKLPERSDWFTTEEVAALPKPVPVQKIWNQVQEDY